LLREKAGRPILPKEVNELLAVEPNPKVYRNYKKKPIKKLEQHHLFELLGGNPQAILLLAPLLSNQEKQYQLKDLYNMVQSQKTDGALEDENIEDSLVSSLRIGLQVTLETIFDGNP